MLRQGRFCVAPTTVFQLTWCFKKTFLLMHKFDSAWAIEMIAEREEWSELPNGATTATCSWSGTSVIRRSSVPPRAWVGPTTNWSQPETAAIRDFRLSTNQNIIIRSSHSQLIQIGMKTTNVVIENQNPVVRTWTRIWHDIAPNNQRQKLPMTISEILSTTNERVIYTPAFHICICYFWDFRKIYLHAGKN